MSGPRVRITFRPVPPARARRSGRRSPSRSRGRWGRPCRSPAGGVVDVTAPGTTRRQHDHRAHHVHAQGLRLAQRRVRVVLGQAEERAVVLHRSRSGAGDALAAPGRASASTSARRIAGRMSTHRVRSHFGGCVYPKQVEAPGDHPPGELAHRDPQVLVAALLRGAHHLAVAVEGREVLGHLGARRWSCGAARGAPRRRPPRRAARAGASPARARSGCSSSGLAATSAASAACTRSSPALRRMLAIRAWAYCT